MLKWLVLLLLCSIAAVNALEYSNIDVEDGGSSEITTPSTSIETTSLTEETTQTTTPDSPTFSTDGSTTDTSDKTPATTGEPVPTITFTGSTDAPFTGPTESTPVATTKDTTDTSNSTPHVSTPASAATTQKDGSTTTGGTTVTTEPPTTTLPPVNMSYAAFDMKCGEDGFCVYSFVAPVNSNSFLATEKSIIDDDDSQLKTVKTSIDEYKSTVDVANGAAQTKLQALRDKLEAAQKTLTLLQSQVDTIQVNLRYATNNLTTANVYLDTLRGDRGGCYYQKCLTPPTPPPPTTPTTPAPSTTVSPCADKNEICQGYEGSCKVDNNGPYCTKCNGNMDGHLLCETSACSSMAVATIGEFVSPGYYAVENVTAYPNASVCSWQLNGNMKLGDIFDVSKLDPSSQLVIYYGEGQSYQITSQFTSARNLNYVFGQATSFTIRLTTTSVPTGSYFKWNTVADDSSHPAMEEPEDQYLGIL